LEQLETKQLPEDGKYDQHKCVDYHDRDQFVAAFPANDSSTHGSSPSVHLLFCWQAQAEIAGVP
jgi:hypothetical protein